LQAKPRKDGFQNVPVGDGQRQQGRESMSSFLKGPKQKKMEAPLKTDYTGDPYCAPTSGGGVQKLEKPNSGRESGNSQRWEKGALERKNYPGGRRPLDNEKG